MDKDTIGRFIDAAAQQQEVARQLLSMHPELLEARWIHNETVLHFLAVEGLEAGVRFLAEAGADVNVVNEFGDGPLLEVALLGNDRVAAILIEHGADPNATSPTRDNVLHAAVQSGNAQLVDLLLTAGARANYETDLGETIKDALPRRPELRKNILAVLVNHGVRIDG
jgi:ankyrin repeat protein